MHRIAQLIRDAALGRSEPRLSAFVESVPLATAIVDADGRPWHANRAWQAVWGDGAAAESILSRIPELAPYCRAAASGETVVTPAISLAADHGAPERWVRAYLFPLKRTAPDVEVGIVLEEVTAQRRAEDAVRDAHRRESLGTLAGGIAHDFNNLLTGILGNASLALRALPDSDQVRELLREVIRSAERGAELTQQLLAYAGKGRLHVTTVDVVALVRDLETRVRESLPPDIAVTYSLSDCAPVAADAGQIRQLLLSLIANAAEAIGGGAGAIAIETGIATVGTDASRQEFGGFEVAPGTYVRLDVRDSGAGMDRRTQARVFDPFFTTKFLGRGLGLAAALGIVRSHNGAIAVRSEPGAGSTFSVLLPLAGAPDAVPRTPEPLRTRASSEHVLVVDDDPAIRRVAAGMLEEHGYTVTTASSGPEAVAKLAESSDIRLALVDLVMPGMGAEETIRAIRRVHPGVPVLGMSGSGGMELMGGVRSGDLSGFIAKPFSAEELAGSVATALRSRSLH